VSPEKPAASLTNNPAASATNNLISLAKPVSFPQVNKTSGSLLSGIRLPLVMALWGAFVWSLYEILSRRKSGDLTPVELYEVAFRLVSAVPLGYASALLVPESVAAFMAFAVSALPLRDIRQIVRKQSLQKLSESPTSSSSLSSKGYLGEALSGMGNDTLARLQELNIETVLDLAYADPIRLVIKTGVPIQLALSWIDQALLAVYVLELKPKFEKLGMPCALDICEFYTRNCFDIATGQDKDWRNNQAVKDLSAKLDIPMENLVPQLLRSIFDDPHTQFLVRVWYGPATNPNEL
jgi:hypothetical protein